MSLLLHLRSISHELPTFSQLLSEKGFDTLDVRDITAGHLANRAVLLLEAHIDQRALMEWRDALERHLQTGGLVVFNGHLAYPLFTDMPLFRVASGRGREDLILERVAPHPVFEGVDCDDLSFRRGVAGFYARGGNPMPPGAQLLHRLHQDGSPVDWIWHRPQGGTVFMHSGNNMWLYQNDATSAARIAPQLVEWMLDYAAHWQQQ